MSKCSFGEGDEKWTLVEALCNYLPHSHWNQCDEELLHLPRSYHILEVYPILCAWSAGEEWDS